MRPEDKPMLDIDGQIAHLLSKGVKFEKITIEEAKTYLDQNNNYFKLRAYRKNFPKHPDGEKDGQYINLDFAVLKDLAIIDMRLRYVLIHMALDIEHFAKVRLIKAVEEGLHDGYQIVADYLSHLQKEDAKAGSHRYEVLMSELNRNRNNPYCGGIIEKYDGCYPIWAFVEIIPFGSFLHFYGYCAEILSNKEMKNEYYLFQSVKELRNATAHNNCILHNMGAKDSKYRTNLNVTTALSSISKTSRKNKLSNARMQQIVTLLYTHSIIVSSEGVRRTEKGKLKELCDRMRQNAEFYVDNGAVLTSFEFFTKCVDILFP